MQKQHNNIDEWCRCKSCTHKLFKMHGTLKGARIEIKCHSCKTINYIGEFENEATKDTQCVTA